MSVTNGRTKDGRKSPCLKLDIQHITKIFEKKDILISVQVLGIFPSKINR